MRFFKKSFLAIALVAIFAATSVLAAAPYTVYENGYTTWYDYAVNGDPDELPSYIPLRFIEGRPFVPVRMFAYLHGITVEWNSSDDIVFEYDGDFGGHIWHTSIDALFAFVDGYTAWAPIDELTRMFGQMLITFDWDWDWEEIEMVEASRTYHWTAENFADVRQPMFDTTDYEHGEMALGFILHLNDYLYSRSPFTYREKEAAVWLVEELLAMGHDFENIEVQEFAFIETLDVASMFMPSLWSVTAPHMMGDGTLRENQLSQNVVLTMPGYGETGGIIIVGAHYDTLPYPGASDNASGTALLLESAQRMMAYENYHTIIYVWFGAEEVGLLGAYIFYDRLTEDQHADIVMMINADVLFEGPYFIYGTGVHGDDFEDEEMLEAALLLFEAWGWSYEEFGMTSEEFNEFLVENLEGLSVTAAMQGFVEIATSETSLAVDAIAERVMDEFDVILHAVPSYIYMSSDQLAFVFSGHTIVTFAGMVWEADEDHPEGGFFDVRVLHSERDDFHYIEANWPGKMMDAMRTFGLLLEGILTSSFN